MMVTILSLYENCLTMPPAPFTNPSTTSMFKDTWTSHPMYTDSFSSRPIVSEPFSLLAKGDGMPRSVGDTSHVCVSVAHKVCFSLLLRSYKELLCLLTSSLVK